MASSAAALPQPTPAQLARGIAGAVPGELSKSPLLGILGVIIGAGVVTLTSRMISLGLPDFKGHLGFGYDESAWIGTAFDVGLMFIGPFTVYLGGLIAPRRILLTAAALFTLLSIFLPLIHNYALVIVAVGLAGLTSGTFYPLTLTFALRNIPLRYLPFTIALYASFVDGAVNIAPSLYGWYRDHLSWHWMFWNSAVITPVMMLCIYFGIPKSPPAKEHGEAPSFAGFLYASAGLALILAACEQGERLDWWHSGVFTALFASGSFLLLCALVRRLLGPNPLVDIPYLRHRDTILLGTGLFFFRFFLVTTIILIPQSLAIHGFEPDQIGPAVIWTAASFVPLAFVAGFLLLSNVRSALAPRNRFCGYGVCLFAGCPAHERMGGARLLPHGIPHGLRSMLRLHRFGLRDHFAGAFLGWVGEAPENPDVFRFFSCRQDFWRNDRSHPHGPVHRRAGETSLKSSGASRAAEEIGLPTEASGN